MSNPIPDNAPGGPQETPMPLDLDEIERVIEMEEGDAIALEKFCFKLITEVRRLRAESWLTMEDGEAIEIVQDFAKTASGHLTGQPASAPATSLADAVQALHIEEGLPHDDSLRLRPDPRAVAAIVVCRDFEPGDEPVMMLAHPTDPGKVRAVFVRDLKRVEVPRG